ncbi:MAG TPA: MBL fold metallo-hydrolase [Jatrophihabitans sp.]|jgi:ribonuclease BN (tRNA processing enzyme)
MKLTVLGCSGSVPAPGNPSSGYLVEADGYRLVVDLGHGAYGELQRYVDPASVDAIILSHLHADHCIDLVAYIVGLRFGGPGFAQDAGRRIPIIGPSGTRGRLEAAYDPLAKKLGLHELFSFGTPQDVTERRTMELGPFALTFATMNHPVPTSAVRIGHGGSSLVYSADTGESDALVSLADGADTLLCEASFGPDEDVPNLHLNGRQAGEHAARSGVGSLIVTHVPPWLNPDDQLTDAATAFSGKVELARRGTVFDL